MHVTKKVATIGIAAASLLAVSLPFAMTAMAQQTTLPQGGQRGGQFGQGGAAAGPGQFGQGQNPPFQGQPGQAPGQFRPGGMMGGGGGGTAIDSDNTYLYIVQGGQVFKINKGDLKVVAQGQLMPMGVPAIRDGGTARPGGGGQGGAFGGGGSEK